MARTLAAAVWLVLGLSAHTAAGVVASASVELPLRLRDTGLYAAGSATEPAAGIVSFSPQYPLWSDGADKQRWLYLPPGSFLRCRCCPRGRGWSSRRRPTPRSPAPGA